MPKSRTCAPKKNHHDFGLKSPDARLKIRRWTFRVEATGDQGTTILRPPTLTIGSSVTAQAAATTLQADISTMPQFAKARIEVIPEPHETISAAIISQIKGLDQQGQFLASALRAATDVQSFLEHAGCFSRQCQPPRTQ